VPVTVPAPGEYVADGAARQAAWVLSGERPTWPIDAGEPLAIDTRPVIRHQYAERATA
jgi:xylulokinase